MSAVDVVTDLLGEIVEISEYGDARYLLRARGTVRAVYLAEGHLFVLVEHNLGYDSAVHQERLKDGGLGSYDLRHSRVCAVRHCEQCRGWDVKERLRSAHDSELNKSFWIHKQDEGCKKVGHGG